MEALLALALLGLLVGLVGVLVVGWRRGRFVVAFATVAAALFVVWSASLLAVSTDYRDADGNTDCWPSCTAYQDAVGSAFFYSLPVLALLTVGSAVALGISALRRRGARRPG